MKKVLFGLLFFISFVFASCESTLYINTLTLESAEIDMSSCRNIAITSTKQFNGGLVTSGAVRFKTSDGSFVMNHSNMSSLPVDLAGHINTVMINQINNTGYFNRVITPPESDLFNSATISTLGISREELIEKNQIDAIVDTSIRNMTFDEYVDTHPVYRYENDAKGNRVRVFDHWSYTLYQELSVEVELKVTDTRKNTVIATKVLKDSIKKEYDIEYGLTISRSPRDEYVNLLNKIANSIAVKMVPHYVYKQQEAMDNNPHNSAASAGYDYLESGATDAAYHIFMELWNTSKHLPSGYNAALLLHGMGKIDDAIALMQNVFDVTKNKAALQMLAEMKASRAVWQQAQDQLEQRK